MPERTARRAGCRWHPVRFRQQYQTYIKVQGRWCYLYRAIDRSGALVDVMFSGFCQRSRQQVSLC